MGYSSEAPASPIAAGSGALTAEKIPPKFWFTSETRLPSFDRDSRHFLPLPTVTPHPSRKHFIAKLLGLAAAAGAGSEVIARVAGSKAPTEVPPAARDGGVQVKRDSRTVARRPDAV